MANVRSSNTYYIDTAFSTTEELAVRNLKLTYVIVTATSNSARVVLADSSVATKLDLRVATSGTTQVFDFSRKPIVFPISVRPTTLTNAIVTCIIEETRGG